MQKITLFLFTLLLSACLFAQDVEYKKGMILVDGNEYAKVDVKKQNFGLTKSFEVFNLAGQKIIIAVVATEFESDKNDNSYLFYRLTFLTAGQVGIFKIPSLSQEKGFAKLIGNSGILVKDTVNGDRLREFIATKSATPSIAVDYTPVSRNRAWPVSLTKDKNVEQNSKIIGSFKPKGSSNNMDFYEFALPSGVIIAKVSFTGGNNAQNMEIFTAKDNYKRVVPIPQQEKIIIADASIDINQFTLKRIAKWLVDNQYL
jgi:hypothetical protein